MRIATRGSELALWQAHHVASLLNAADPLVKAEIVVISTSGDRDKSTPLHEIGGKGIFVKEVQVALLDGRADIAVHSAKDMPAVSPDQLTLGAVPERGNPCDALIGSSLADLRPGAVVATGSVRRRAQLLATRSDLVFAELRGNMGTRIDRAGEFDAIVVAAAALERLNIAPADLEIISSAVMVPQVGQGSLAAECRHDDVETLMALEAIEHGPSRRRFDAERAFLRELGGDCSLPAGAYAELDAGGQNITLTGFLAAEDLRDSVQVVATGTDAESLGTELARDLRSRVESKGRA